LTENKQEKAKFFWLFYFQKKPKVFKIARISKSGFKKAKCAALLHKNWECA